MRFWCAGLLVLAGLIAGTGPAHAQLSGIGVNPALISFAVRGSDAAYDPVNDVYLVVGSHGVLRGIFVNSAGTPVSGAFQISEGTPPQFAQFPRVLYSRHLNNGAGGFLVTWHQNVGLPNLVHTRVVAYPGQLVTPQQQIPSDGTWWESGAAIAYSETSRVFLVVWRSAANKVLGARVGLNGLPIGAAFPISDPTVFGRDPSVVWNPFTNEFGVIYTGWDATRATTAFARVSAGGAVLSRNLFNSGPATYITDIAFNTSTGRYLATWSQFGTYGVEFDAAGNVVTQGLLSSTTGTYDGLGLSYNPQSGTFLLVGHGPSFEVWAAELNSRGARTSADVSITNSGGPIGAFYPRAAANSEARQWVVPFAHNFAVLRDQAVATSSSGGGPAGTLGAPSGGGTSTPPPPTSGGGCTTPDPFAAMGGGTCVNGGWLPPSGGSTGGSTGGCTTPSPGTGWTCVNGGWRPPSGGSSGSGSTGGCTTPDPFIAMGGGTCVNGGWVMGGSGGSTGGSSGSTGGCTTPDPFAAMGGGTCVNGGWVMGGSGGSTGGSSGSSGGCTTPDPFVAIGGGTCVNGGWQPKAMAGGCTTPDPFVALGGGICSNGGWLPPSSGGAGGGSTGGGSTGGCTTPDPFTAMGGGTCINGGWVPSSSTSTTTTASSGGCSTPDPFAAMGGGTCVNGGWIFGGSSTSSTGGCTTPDPFTAMGGGICVNGGWIPKN